MRHFIAAVIILLLILLLIPVGLVLMTAFTPLFLGAIAAVAVTIVIAIFLIPGGIVLGGRKGTKDAIKITKWIALILLVLFTLSFCFDMFISGGVL